MRIVLLLLIPALGLGLATGADDPPGTYHLVSPRPLGIVATGLNGRGDLVGFQWVEDREHPGVLTQLPIFARGKEITPIPVLAGYTATFPAAVSDAGLVVGRSSRPSRPGGNLTNQAFLWDADHGIRGLGVLPGDNASFACGIARDGSRISGLSVGPDRIRACVWDRGGGGGWTATPLPQTDRLGSNVVPISDDGRCVAAADGLVPCLWTVGADGTWAREALGPAGSLLPRGVNNDGSVAGLSNARNGMGDAVVWTRATGSLTLEIPQGYRRAEASAINNAGAVVGTVDGPSGSEIGPNAFVYERGRLRLLTEFGPNFSSATAVNDRGDVAGVLEEPEKEEPEPAKT